MSKYFRPLYNACGICVWKAAFGIEDNGSLIGLGKKSDWFSDATLGGGFLKKKTIKMSPELARMMEEQLAAFREKFGRDAGPEDPIFFDPDADTPQPISTVKLRRIVVHAAEEAGLDPELVLAALGFNESD